MSDGDRSGGNVLEEAIIKLRYAVSGEKDYKKFIKSLDSIESGGISRKAKVGVEVDEGALRSIGNIRKKINDSIGRFQATVGIKTSVGGGVSDETKRFFDRARSDAAARKLSGDDKRTTITAESIRELGSASKAAAEAIRRSASGLSLPAGRQASAISGFYRSSSQLNRLDAYGADANLDRAMMAGNMSGMRFSPASMNPSKSSRNSSSLIPRVDMSRLKQGLEAGSGMVDRFSDRVRSKLEMSPGIDMGSWRSSLNGAVAQLGVAGLVTGFGKTLDEAQQLTDQIRNLSPTLKDAEIAQAGLLDVAKQTNSSYRGTVDLYSSLAVIADRTKLSVQQNTDITRAINMSSQLGGGSAMGHRRAIIQLEQAFQMGKMDGQGMNSIESQSRGLAKALAEGMGKSVADLKRMTKEGKLTSEVMTQALLKVAPKLQEQFKNVRVTFGGLKNYAGTMALEWATKLSKMWDGWGKGMGAARNALASFNDFVQSAFGKFAGFIGSGENASKALQMALLSLGGGAVLAAISAFGGAVLAALWPVAVAAGAVFTAFLAIDDVIGWIQGKDSVMTDLVGPFSKFKPMFDDISSAVSGFYDTWQNMWNSAGGVKDALSTGQEPPLAAWLRSMLTTIKETIQSMTELLKLYKAYQEGDYGTLKGKGASMIRNGIDRGTGGLGWTDTAMYSTWGDNPREGWAGPWIKAVDWMTGSQTPSKDQRIAYEQQQQAQQGYMGQMQTTHNIDIKVDANGAGGQEISSEITSGLRNFYDSLNGTKLPTAERGPR